MRDKPKMHIENMKKRNKLFLFSKLSRAALQALRLDWRCSRDAGQDAFVYIFEGDVQATFLYKKPIVADTHGHRFFNPAARTADIKGNDGCKVADVIATPFN